MTPWQATLEMLRTIPKRRTIDGHIKFKAVEPDQVVQWMKKYPGANTVEAIIEGMKITRSTAKRIMASLVDEGALLIDRESHPRHFIYKIPKAD